MVSHLKDFCQERLPLLGSILARSTLGEVTSVLTAKSCGEPQSYEKLEWLGNVVLKLVHTDCIIKSRDLKDWVQCFHEGQLDVLRSALGQNKRFEDVCKALGID
jgi:dsRNA-specific ribonuclease